MASPNAGVAYDSEDQPCCWGLAHHAWECKNHKRHRPAQDKDSSAPATPPKEGCADPILRREGDTRIVATATAAQGPGSGDGGERPALSTPTPCEDTRLTEEIDRGNDWKRHVLGEAATPREHAAKLRRLEREARGELVPGGDY